MLWSLPRESYFPTYVWADKSFIQVEECQWLLVYYSVFHFTAIFQTGFLSQAMQIHLQMFGLALHQHMANLSFPGSFFLLNVIQRKYILFFYIAEQGENWKLF